MPSRRTAAEMRAYVTSMLTDWGVPKPVCDDMQLITSELTTNAVIHTHSRIAVSVMLSYDEAVVTVVDRGLCRARNPAPEAERGRGLLIVENLASRWERRETPGGGTTVEAAITLPGHQLASPPTSEDSSDAPRSHP